MTTPLAQAESGLRGRLHLILAALAVLGMAVAIGLAATADAKRAKVLGKTKSTPNPSCPQNCQVMGQVTGFQRSATGKKGLFRLDEPGKLVAWSVDLSKPNKDDRAIFEQFGGTDRYGDGPTAGVGVLRKEGRERYKLIRRSPIVKMRSYYNEQPVITLNRPLRARRGDIIALITATWLPNFASGVSRENVWVASRNEGECDAADPKSFFEQSHPHLKEGSTRRYACKYDRARLLYWGYFVAKGDRRN